jgi:hypothetical protein
MDQNTTNINELPIDPNPPENREMPLDIPRSIDRSMPVDEQEKKVHFNEDNFIEPIPKTSLYEIDDTHKIIILATIFFLLFSDNKVRNYIMTILVGIFGNILKTQAGGISKVGLVAYSIVYGLSLFVLVNLIEILIDKYL